MLKSFRDGNNINAENRQYLLTDVVFAEAGRLKETYKISLADSIALNKRRQLGVTWRLFLK